MLVQSDMSEIGCFVIYVITDNSVRNVAECVFLKDAFPFRGEFTTYLLFFVLMN